MARANWSTRLASVGSSKEGTAGRALSLMVDPPPVVVDRPGPGGTAKGRVEVIDAHQHVGEAMAHVGEDRLPVPGLDCSAEELDDRLASMDAAGIDQAIVIPGHKYL